MKEDVFELSLEPRWRDDARRAYSMIIEMGDRIMTITEREVDELLAGAIDMVVRLTQLSRRPSALRKLLPLMTE